MGGVGVWVWVRVWVRVQGQNMHSMAWHGFDVGSWDVESGRLLQRGMNMGTSYESEAVVHEGAEQRENQSDR